MFEAKQHDQCCDCLIHLLYKFRSVGTQRKFILELWKAINVVSTTMFPAGCQTGDIDAILNKNIFAPLCLIYTFNWPQIGGKIVIYLYIWNSTKHCSCMWTNCTTVQEFFVRLSDSDVVAYLVKYNKLRFVLKFFYAFPRLSQKLPIKYCSYIILLN